MFWAEKILQSLSPTQMRMAELNASRNEAGSYNLKLTLKCQIHLKLLKLNQFQRGEKYFYFI